MKYLFKYMIKGHDRITTSFYQTTQNERTSEIVDEIKMHYDCRYIFPCEVVWRTLGFPINYREPAVERLSFHLLNEQTIVFHDDELIDDVVRRSGEDNTMFLQWFKANEQFSDARELTHVQFSQKFVWRDVEEIDELTGRKKKIKRWMPRKRDFFVGRIFYVHPGAGELYYFRLLLNFVKGPTCYEDIIIVDGVIHANFKDACFALGLLDDDKEYVDAIIEASIWGLGNYL